MSETFNLVDGKTKKNFVGGRGYTAGKHGNFDDLSTEERRALDLVTLIYGIFLVFENLKM